MKRKMSITVLIVALIAVSCLLSGCRLWTIVKNDEQGTADDNGVYFGSTDFDVTTYVNNIWDNELMNYYSDKKQDASMVISDISQDVNAAGEKYGFGSSQQGDTWSFVVEGKGKVLLVNQESRQGLMMVDLEPYDGVADVQLQIGPIIKGTAIRDTINTIKLSDFANQVLFASISKALNERVLNDVIGSIDLSTVVDKEVTFLGAFTYTSPEEVVVTPVLIEIGGGN